MNDGRPNDQALNCVVRTTTTASPDPSASIVREAMHGSGTAAVGSVQAATGTPLRNTPTAAAGVPPSSLESIVKLARYGCDGSGATGARWSPAG